MNSLNSNINKICRTCLEQKNELISLYSVDNITGIQLCEMILQITSQVQVFTKENAPSSICPECHYKLNITFQFIEQCKNSELKLQEFIRSCPQENDSNVNDKEIEAAVQELFGNEGNEQDINLVENVVLSSDLDSNLKSNDLLNMDMILGEKPIKKSKKILKNKKKSSHLDELLKNHKERMKLENSSKIQIFKQKRKKKITTLIEPEQCFQCGKIFHYKGYMELHLRTHSNYKAYECNICSKKFTQVSNLNLHLRIHTNERPFCCEKCPKMFSTSSNLKAHLRTHINFKPFQCNLCNKAFKSSTELKSHEGTHSQIKNKICKFCGKSFYKTSYLNVHIKNIHYGLKKYHCDGCNKSFSNSSNLIAHKRIHTGDKPYSCKFDGCCAKFNQSSSLVRHMKSHNKTPKLKIEVNKQHSQNNVATSSQQEQQQVNQIQTQENLQQSIQVINQLETVNQDQPHIQPQQNILASKQQKKTPYIIPELLKDISLSDNIASSENINAIQTKMLPSCQQAQNSLINQHSYISSPQSLLPEALNPINLINNTSNSNYTTITTHPATSLLLAPLPPNHDTPQISDHQMHHFPNFENSAATTFFPTTPNIIPNSFNFIMSGLDFSKNSLNGEPTYIDY